MLEEGPVPVIGRMECGGRFVRQEETRDLLEERDRLLTMMISTAKLVSDSR